MTEQTTDRLFDYKLNQEGVQALLEAKIAFSDVQEKVLGKINGGRNKSLVRTHLEMASFYMSRAIAEQPENHFEINTY